jgi:DNA-binding NarL/FixJ family response regulator
MGESKMVNLSPREIEVSQLVAQGFSSKHISESLCISDATFKTHLTNIYQKLGFPVNDPSIHHRVALANFIQDQYLSLRMKRIQQMKDRHHEMV